MNEFEPTQPVKSADPQTNMWAMILHLSQLLNYIIPFGGIIAPMLIWQLKKNDLPGLDIHGKIVANWLITALVIYLICIPLAVVFIGAILAIALTIAHVIFAIIGGIKANNGEVWPYPMTFIKPF